MKGWTNDKVKALCLDLMKADTEAEVIELLKQAGFWDDHRVWRFYGDNENNYSTIGNQQGRSDAALVEKLVNSVDARLMNECLLKGRDPQGPLAPKTVEEAVADFFGEAGKGLTGRIKHWSNTKRTEVAKGITLAATGADSGKDRPPVPESPGQRFR